MQRRYAAMLDMAQILDDLGGGMVSLEEHHGAPNGWSPSPLIMAGAIFGRTKSVSISISALLVPLHDPLRIAEDIAVLDLMSGGRLSVIGGIGYRPEEYGMYGVPMPERVSRFNEAVTIVRRLWTEERVTHNGRHWQFSDATIGPRPLQRPAPPIIIGAQVQAAITRAANIGDGWLVVPIPTLDQLAKQMATYTTARTAAKLAPSPHICRLLEVGCGPDTETAFRRVAPHLIEKYKAYFSWGLEGLTLDPNATPEEQFRSLAVNRFAVGSPAQVADMLVAQHKAGINHLSMRVSWPGMAQTDILAGIELLGTEVLPEVRKRTA